MMKVPQWINAKFSHHSNPQLYPDQIFVSLLQLHLLRENTKFIGTVVILFPCIQEVLIPGSYFNRKMAGYLGFPSECQLTVRKSR